MRIWIALVVAACGRARFDEHAVDAKITYRAAVIASGPIGYYRLGDAHDEITGQLATLAGGCTMNATGAVTDDPDTAFAMDGTCRITLPVDYDFAGTRPFALEAWVSTQANAAFHLPITREVRGPLNPIDGYAMVVAPPGFELERVVAGDNVKAGPIAFTPDVYHHVVTQFTGGESQLFIDGQIEDRVVDTRSMNEVASETLLGAAMPGNFYFGSLDEVAIYDHVLTPEEIAGHHAIGIGE